jgi:DNA-binding NtrC family response regulator
MELMPKDAQVRLAEALTKKEITRQGSSSPIHVEVRIISEASIDPKKHDDLDPTLYKMLGQSVIELPPVRQRESDIPVLIEHYLDRYNGKYNKKVKISAEAMEIMASYQWPGNIAELANTIETIALTLKKDVLAPDDLPLDLLIKSTSGGRPYTSLESMESRLEASHILNIYNKAGHSKEKTAALLGIQQKTLEAKLESINV